MTYEHSLPDKQRPLARSLWEEIFPEDSKEFLDAFYKLKAGEVILGQFRKNAKGERALVSMVQLDRCRLMFGRGNEISVNYLVGAATLPEYRRQGLLREIFYEAMRVGAAAGEPFIFLMPANAEVYLPMGFRTVYEQTNYLAPEFKAESVLVFSKGKQEARFIGRVAGHDDCGSLAEISSEILSSTCDTYFIRDKKYFSDLIIETGSENGNVICLYACETPERLAGYLCFTPNEDGTALVREIVVDTPPRLIPAGVSIAKKRPQIMVRVLDPAEYLKPLKSDGSLTFYLDYTDDILTRYSGLYRCETGPDGCKASRIGEAKAEESDAPPKITASADTLAEAVFGKRDGFFPEGIELPSRILINEWI